MQLHQSLNGILSLRSANETDIIAPLTALRVHSSQPGRLVVHDGAGDEVFAAPLDAGGEALYTVGGALGTQNVLLIGRDGEVVDRLRLRVGAKTEVRDAGGEFARLFQALQFSMFKQFGGAHMVRNDGRLCEIFSRWFQDHMYILLAMKYFHPEVTSGVDLYAMGQRADGMIPDKYKTPVDPDGPDQWRFGYGDFVHVPAPNSSHNFVRIPVENMGEFTFIECVHMTWMASGCDAWMTGKLDSMLKAVEYATTDPYRWSEKFQLLKRGYTVDIWDFQAKEDTAIAGNDIMKVYLDKTRFNIMYGDNVRFAYSCLLLGEMLDFAGRADEAARVRQLGQDIKHRIDDLSWNGEFYRHMVPEDPNVQRDFGGTDETRQVTLSNAWALTRGITHDQAVAIIETYRRIRREMPESSPGEWYMCYPPFEKGWGCPKWDYMNGGVSPIVAGELALGCFEHGYEDYGVDILRRVGELTKRHGDLVLGAYKGKVVEPPERSFRCLDLRDKANADTHGEGAEGVPVWAGDKGNDLPGFPTGRQEFDGIPFDVIDPASNGRRAVLGLCHTRPGYADRAVFEIGGKAASLYFLHVLVGGPVAGCVTFHYEDGSTASAYISKEKSVAAGSMPSVGEFWFPQDMVQRRGTKTTALAWKGSNSRVNHVGVWLHGLDNPHPDRAISRVELEAQKDGALWLILGMTLSDAPAFLTPSEESGLPQCWAAAECLYALIEGLGGVVATERGMRRLRLSPRWTAAGAEQVAFTAVLEACEGYVAYEYGRTDEGLALTFTGTPDEIELNILLPDGMTPDEVRLDGAAADFSLAEVEGSRYVRLTATGPQVRRLEIRG